MDGEVLAVARDAGHNFSKQTVDQLLLIENMGVSGDAHLGVTVKHRSRVAVDPSQPNLRQVHLLQSELFDELLVAGYRVAPGDLGENITTKGIDLLGLPRGAMLEIGAGASLQVTGLRNPCTQIDRFMPGLLGQVLTKGADGAPIRNAGIMTIVASSGIVRPADKIHVTLPSKPWHRLERV